MGDDEATRRQCDKPKLTRFKESVDIKDSRHGQRGKKATNR
jgi:hypothetical protein